MQKFFFESKSFTLLQVRIFRPVIEDRRLFRLPNLEQVILLRSWFRKIFDPIYKFIELVASGGHRWNFFHLFKFSFLLLWKG